MTENRYTAKRRGPVTFEARLNTEDLEVVVEDRGYAEFVVATADDAGPSADAVRAAAFDEAGDTVALTVEVVGGVTQVNSFQSGRRSTQINNFRSGGGVNVVQVGGTVYGNVYGVVVGGDNYGTIAGPGFAATVALNGSPISVTARLPRGSRIEVKSSTGGVRARGAFVRPVVHTSTGDISLDEAEEPRLQSSTGDITVSVVRGGGRFQASTGDIRIGSANDGKIIATTSTGDVTVFGSATVSARSATGRVRTGR